jgi:ABC-type glycerol-3-phosphate transport system substrate-binding protein
MQFQMDLTSRYRVTPSIAELGAIQGGAVTAWYVGRLTIINSIRERAPDFEKLASSQKGHVPWPSGKKGRFNSDGLNSFSIYGQTRYRDQAWQFVKFLTTTGHEIVLVAGSTNPIRKAMRNDPKYIKSLLPWEKAEVYHDASETAMLVFMPPRFTDIDRVLQAGWTKAANGEATVKAEMLRVKPEVDGLLRAEQYNFE